MRSGALCFSGFIQEFAARVARGVTPKARRENLRERIGSLPRSVSNRDAETILRHEGWKVSYKTIERERRNDR